MSRSRWAWSKSCAFVGAALRGAGKRGTDEVQPNLGYRRRSHEFFAHSPQLGGNGRGLHTGSQPGGCAGQDR